MRMKINGGLAGLRVELKPCCSYLFFSPSATKTNKEAVKVIHYEY